MNIRGFFVGFTVLFFLGFGSFLAVTSELISDKHGHVLSFLVEQCGW